MSESAVLFLQRLLLFFESADYTNKKTKIELQTTYYDISKQDREELIRIIIDFKSPYLLLLSLSTLLCNKDDDEWILKNLMKCISESNLGAEETLKYFIQCRFLSFVYFPNLREDLIKLYTSLFEQCLTLYNKKIEYINFNSRNHNRIMIITNQLLGDTHSPSQLTINLWYFLKEIGYEVDILVMSESHIGRPTLWNAQAYKMNNFSDQEELFTMKYYGHKVTGTNLFYETSDLKTELEEAIFVIRKYNPAFIVSMGDMSLLADIASKFTTVIVSGFSKDFPITKSKYVIYTGEQENKDKISFKYQYDTYLAPEEKGNETVIEMLRRDDRFKVLIVGNRLDHEVKNEFINELNMLTHECPNIAYVIVGDCNKLKDYIQASTDNSHYIFTGFVDNLPGITKECNIYLNPPRSGGGFSAKIALKYGLPVITNGNCDVSLWSGAEFICNDLSSLISDVKKCYQDKEYKEYRSKKAMERWNQIASSKNEGIQRTKDFVTSVLTQINVDSL